MKTVLEHGSAWKRRNLVITCPHCECVFMFDKYDDREQDYDAWYHPKGLPYVVCPECGNRIENFEPKNDYIK